MVFGCCSFESPCGLAEGDCDYDNECLGGLLCGTNNCFFFLFSYGFDCCYHPALGTIESKTNGPLSKNSLLK